MLLKDTSNGSSEVEPPLHSLYSIQPSDQISKEVCAEIVGTVIANCLFIRSQKAFEPLQPTTCSEWSTNTASGGKYTTLSFTLFIICAPILHEESKSVSLQPTSAAPPSLSKRATFKTFFIFKSPCTKPWLWTCSTHWTICENIRFW